VVSYGEFRVGDLRRLETRIHKRKGGRRVKRKIYTGGRYRTTQIYLKKKENMIVPREVQRRKGGSLLCLGGATMDLRDRSQRGITRGSTNASLQKDTNSDAQAG